MAIYRRRMKNGKLTRHYFYDFVFMGKRHKGCTSCRGKEKARAFEEDIRITLRRGGVPLGPTPEKVTPTFEAYALAHLDGAGAQKKSKAGDKSILDRALIPFFGKMTLDEITRADVERFKNARLAGKLIAEKHKRRQADNPSPQTVKNELGLLKCILNVAVDDDLLPKNPAGNVKVDRFSNRRGRVIDAEELARLLMAVPPKKAPHLRPLMILAYETGMREAEILGLKWADVDLKLHVARLAETKNGESRKVPLSEKAEKALAAWGRKDDTYVFPARKVPGKDKAKGKGHLGHVSHAFRRLAERAEVEDVRFHDFRHTFCTRMEGKDLRTIAAVTGHKTLAMLMRYTHPTDAATLALVRAPEAGAPTPKPTHTGDPEEKEASEGIA